MKKIKKIAVYAGSFCPFTKGHEDIVMRALPLFDIIHIAVACNSAKNDIFTVKQRVAWIEELYKDNPKIKVCSYGGLTSNFCSVIGASYLIRGVRNGHDFTYEQNIADVNRQLNPELDTVVFISSPDKSFISSSLVRELWKNRVDYSKYVSYKLPKL